MKVSKIIGQNIKDLMIARNISNRKMAEIIDVTHPTVGKYITGEQVIDSEKLSIIANFFHKSLDYFFSVDHESFDMLFRVDKPEMALEGSDISEIETKFKEYIDVVGKTRMSFVPQKYSLLIASKSLNEEDESFIEKVACEQRKFFNIEHIIPDNYFSVFAEKGVNVISSTIKNESFFGASSYSEEYGSFVYVNSNMAISEERQIFTLVHEYGHLLFHQNEYRKMNANPCCSGNEDAVNEKIVNSFAGYFLLPRYLVREYIENNKEKKIDVMEMKRHFKVSIQTLYVALYKYGYISKNQYADFWRRVSVNDWKNNEPNPVGHVDAAAKNPKLMVNLKKLYRNDEISSQKISQILDMDLVTTRQLLKKWSEDDGQYEYIA